MRIVLLSFLLLWNSQLLASELDTDAQTILNRLLSIQNPKNTYTDEKGGVFYDFLKDQQQWTGVYTKYKKQIQNSDERMDENIKYWLFIGFVARVTKGAEIQEAFSGDLVPMYEQKPRLFLKILKELPFLIPPTCYYMNNYFGFEDKNICRRSRFVEENKVIIYNTLGQELGSRCLDCFTK